MKDSAHVRSLSLGVATDEALWSYAAEHAFLLVTKDEDFLSLSVRRGFPPMVSHPEAGFLLLGLNPTQELGPAVGKP